MDTEEVQVLSTGFEQMKGFFSLPKGIRRQMETDARKARKMEDQYMDLVRDEDRAYADFVRIRDRKDEVYERKEKFSRKRYPTEGYLGNGMEERKKKLLHKMKERILRETFDADPWIKDYTVTGLDNDTITILLEICGPSTSGEPDAEGRESCLLARLEKIGIAPFVSAVMRIGIDSLSSDGEVKVNSFHAHDLNHWSETYWVSFAEGSLPNPHYYQFSCLGEWVRPVLDAKHIVQMASIVSHAARNINYSEEEERRYLQSTDLSAISAWGYEDESGVRRIHEGRLNRLLDRYDTDTLKQICDGCRPVELLCRGFASRNPIPRNTPCDGNPEDCPVYDKCECCYIGRYLKVRKRMEMTV